MRRNTNHTLNRVHPFSTIMNYYVSNKFRNSNEAYFLKQKTGKGIGNGGGGYKMESRNLTNRVKVLIVN